MKFTLLLFVIITGVFSSAVAGKTMWQPNFAFRVMLAFDEERGFEYIPAYESLRLPDYPPVMRRLAFGGDVEFEFTVLKDGSIAEVVLRAKRPEFRAAVAESMKTWRFAPLEKNPGLPPLFRTFPDRVKLVGMVRFEVPEDVELYVPEPGFPTNIKDDKKGISDTGLTYELDEATGRRRYEE